MTNVGKCESAKARKRELARSRGGGKLGRWEDGKLGQGRGQESRGTRDDADDDADQERCLVSLRSCSLVLAHILILVLGHCCIVQVDGLPDGQPTRCLAPLKRNMCHVGSSLSFRIGIQYSARFCLGRMGIVKRCGISRYHSISITIDIEDILN